MKKIILTLGVLCLMLGMVSAVDCSGYFTKAADKRIKVVSASSSLELTIERLGSRADNLYNQLDDMNNDENLTSASDYFSDFVDRKNDAADDMSNLKSALDAYDNAISDSREDLPNSCFKVFNMYDSDLGDVDDYYSNVRTAWNKFTPRYDVIAAYRSNLAGHTVGEAKPKTDDIRDYIDDVYSEVSSNLATTINATTGVTDEKIYNQTECFGMITKNVDIATKGCVDKCNLELNKISQNCTTQVQCPQCQDCSLVQQSLNTCQTKLSTQAQCPVCPVCQSGDTAAKDTQISSLNTQVSQLSGQLNSANANVNDITLKYNNATAQLAKVSVCESCGMYKIGCILLVLLILLAWIFKM